MPKSMGRICHSVDLPTCELHRLGEIADLVASVRLSRIRKQKLALALKNEGYIPKLLELFQVCESVKNTEGLHLLFDIVRGILYLDKAILFEVMFSDECILDVVGCLEYDPCLAQPGWHREILTKTAKLQEVIPIRDPELRQKIRQTSRAQYIHAIIMPNSSDFEADFLSTLNSFISSSKEEILHALQKDEEFLPEVFAQLKNEATAGEQQCELMKFFKEFCAFSFTVPEKRDEFLQTLAKLGFLPILEMLMGMDNQQVRSAATDILSYLVEFSPATIQQFVMQEAQQNENDTQLITEIIEQIIRCPDPEFGGDNQLMEILCALIDPEKMLAIASNLEVFEFLDIFYDRYIHVLTAPLLADTSEEWYKIDNYQTAEILASVLELLSFCVEQHKYHMKIFIIKKDLLRRTLVLMKSKHKFLALCALRFMRRIIGLKDELYNHYITLGNLFEPVVNTVLDNRNKCNLLKSASLELFEFIRKEDIQFLIAHIVENFSDALESVKSIHTFQGLKTKYEQEKDRQNQKLNSVPFMLPGETFVKEAVVSQVDEDVQFREGEEKAAPTSPASSKGSSPMYTTLTTVETAPKRGLCEIFGYPDDEDDGTSPKKRACLDS
ncbi:serine/threonine-protein phosphatase 4 regulatory subunit 3B-like isoform X1 [Vidua chalybeata]|uniref:serine/threonine-protein phosphatase 4 regulatory subunit 3B-like isoform X1 n=1 Tax=Vidua chalybeata TaxID=81927 RepID=UPI0023A8F336|nr:serine/threonine-protein phosphatase 4 regulatory subunit 3B-like isoform X1 [Vidua chalybeata]